MLHALAERHRQSFRVGTRFGCPTEAEDIQQAISIEIHKLRASVNNYCVIGLCKFLPWLEGPISFAQKDAEWTRIDGAAFLAGHHHIRNAIVIEIGHPNPVRSLVHSSQRIDFAFGEMPIPFAEPNLKLFRRGAITRETENAVAVEIAKCASPHRYVWGADHLLERVAAIPKEHVEIAQAFPAILHRRDDHICFPI